MKNLSNNGTIYISIFLIFSMIILVVNYMSINSIDKYKIKVFSENDLNIYENDNNIRKKEELMEQAKFWGIPQEIIKEIN